MMEKRKKIAFYAPLKSPEHSVPSGDRTIARLLLKALGRAGFDTELACHVRTWDGAGDLQRQKRIGTLMEKVGSTLIKRWQNRGERPDIWFTYHSYYKAPDWLGPMVAEKLHIPYVVAEASWAAKRGTGSWAVNSKIVERGLRMAARIFILNPVDRQGLVQLLGDKAPLVSLPPFLDTDSFVDLAYSRAELASRWGLDEELPWIVAVGMMRPGDKLRSYQLLAQAFSAVGNPCNLILIGDGESRREVEDRFGGDRRVRFLGKLNHEEIFPLFPQALFFIWPAVNEAFGMSLLEAQWMHLPVVACDEGGVSSILRDGTTGRLLPCRDVGVIAKTMAELLDCEEHPLGWKKNCRKYIASCHSLSSASKILADQLFSIPGERRC